MALQRSTMPIQILDSEYLTAAEVCQLVAISRQTLWRWRQEGLIPQGRRLRGQWLLFSSEDLKAIRSYAMTLEPADAGPRNQMKLFAKAYD